MTDTTTTVSEEVTLAPTPSKFEHRAIVNLPSGIVIDKSQLMTLSAAETAEVLGTVYTLGKTIVVVDNKATFLTTKKLLADLESGDNNWTLIAEHFDLSVTPMEQAILKRAVEIRRKITEMCAAVKLPYSYAKTSVDFEYDKYFDPGVNRISRRHGRNGYSITYTQLERVWNACRDYWLNLDGASNTLRDIRADGGSSIGRIDGTGINIGCQRLERWEIEQVAIKRGWVLL